MVTRAVTRRRAHRALGDRARWLAFAAPLAGALATCARMGFRARGTGGAALGCVTCALALPFWRALCGRPTFAFYGLALRRYRARAGGGAFEDEGGRAATLAEAMRDAAAALSRELAAFVRNACEGVDGGGGRGGRLGEERQPSEKLRDAGWGTIPLHDETLDAPSRLATRCFPSASAAVASVGGFNGKIWVLSPGAGGASSVTGRVTSGLSDGYWRVHVVLARDAGLHGKAAGLRSGDDTRSLELGSVHIVNDFHPNAFWNVSRDSGLVLLSFDVATPEHESCRAALVETRARLTRAFGATSDDYGGDANLIAYVWRVFSLTLISNLS